MGLRPYDLERANADFNQFYDQRGGGYTPIPTFKGFSNQRGYGLGGILGSLFKSVALPMLSKGAMSLGKRALSTGINIAQDGLRGENVGKSLKRNAKAAGLDTVREAIKAIGGGGAKRKSTPKRKNKTNRSVGKRVSRKKTVKRRRAKTQRVDIFG